MPNIKNLTCVHRKNCILAKIRKFFIYFGKKMIFWSKITQYADYKRSD